MSLSFLVVGVSGVLGYALSRTLHEIYEQDFDASTRSGHSGLEDVVGETLGIAHEFLQPKRLES